QLTLGCLIKLLAYAGLFFVIVLYPFRQSERHSAQDRLYSCVLMAMLVSGLLVAAIGILERAFWNGKILWIFIPYDWAGPLDHLQRASGPFVSPDHFSSYLNLVLPVAIAAMLFPTALTRRNREAFRVFCAAATLVISIAVMMSLSRAGWLGA